MFGPPVALTLKRPFFMIRKNGKMPNVIQSTPYTKEYKVGTKECAQCCSHMKFTEGLW